MNLVCSVGAARVLFLLCVFSGMANGERASPILSVESHNPLKLSVFDGGKMYGLPVPTDFMDEVESVYNEVRIEDLTGDGVGEVLFDLKGDGVNSCSRVLRYERDDRLLKELLFVGGGLCNFVVRDGYIVSSYKDGAAWAEDIYGAGCRRYWVGGQGGVCDGERGAMSKGEVCGDRQICGWGNGIGFWWTCRCEVIS